MCTGKTVILQISIKDNEKMRIKHLVIENFRAIERLEIDCADGMNVFIGDNGTGKSSFLKAVRYALTGEGGIVNDNETEMSVTIDTEDADIPQFTRGIIVKNGKNEGKVEVNGNTGKATYLNNEIVRIANVKDMDALKATTLSKVVANMNPADFGSFIMQYLPEKLTREKILDNVWDYDYFGDARTVDTHVKKLRAKLKEYGRYIQTIWGMGYKFEAK